MAHISLINTGSFISYYSFNNLAYSTLTLNCDHNVKNPTKICQNWSL
jgi:hypothetical protein